MGACPACYRSQEVAGYDCIGVGSADSDLWPISEWVDSAWAHCAYSAADAEHSEAALGLLLL
jgi:hypothetical protein